MKIKIAPKVYTLFLAGLLALQYTPLLKEVSAESRQVSPSPKPSQMPEANPSNGPAKTVEQKKQIDLLINKIIPSPSGLSNVNVVTQVSTPVSVFDLPPAPAVQVDVDVAKAREKLEEWKKLHPKKPAPSPSPDPSPTPSPSASPGPKKDVKLEAEERRRGLADEIENLKNRLLATIPLDKRKDFLKDPEIMAQLYTELLISEEEDQERVFLILQDPDTGKLRLVHWWGARTSDEVYSEQISIPDNTIARLHSHPNMGTEGLSGSSYGDILTAQDLPFLPDFSMDLLRINRPNPDGTWSEAAVWNKRNLPANEQRAVGVAAQYIADDDHSGPFASMGIVPGQVAIHVSSGQEMLNYVKDAKVLSEKELKRLGGKEFLTVLFDKDPNYAEVVKGEPGQLDLRVVQRAWIFVEKNTGEVLTWCTEEYTKKIANPESRGSSAPYKKPASP